MTSQDTYFFKIFNDIKYIQSYPDLTNNKINNKIKAWKHFDSYGWKESRYKAFNDIDDFNRFYYYKYFNWKKYLIDNPQLKKIFPYIYQQIKSSKTISIVITNLWLDYYNTCLNTDVYSNYNAFNNNNIHLKFIIYMTELKNKNIHDEKLKQDIEEINVICNKIRTEHDIIKIIASNTLYTTSSMVKKMLSKLNIDSRILPTLTEDCIHDSSLYIIIFNDKYSPQKKSKNSYMPKNYIFWQIEQTSTEHAPNEKFTDAYFNDMNKSLCIFEISEDNIPYYNDVTTQSEIYYNQLPFSDLMNFRIDEQILYEYDIVFFGCKNARRELILSKLNKKLGKQYRFRFSYSIHGDKRDNMLKHAKYVLNIHYYTNPVLECDRFNVSINSNCLILSENVRFDKKNKIQYDYFARYFDTVKFDKNTGEPDTSQLEELIHHNLQDEVFEKNMEYFYIEKKKLENNCLKTFKKNLKTQANKTNIANQLIAII
jgi:hypothetical protein